MLVRLSTNKLTVKSTFNLSSSKEGCELLDRTGQDSTYTDNGVSFTASYPLSQPFDSMCEACTSYIGTLSRQKVKDGTIQLQQRLSNTPQWSLNFTSLTPAFTSQYSGSFQNTTLVPWFCRPTNETVVLTSDFRCSPCTCLDFNLLKTKRICFI
jgi:hypothetical protein